MAFKKINDVSCKDSTVATFVNFSDVDPITRHDFKTNGKKEQISNDTQNCNPWGNITSKLFDELSHSGFNFGESKNLIDSSNSTKVNSFMVDATDMDENLKKTIDEKNLQIAELIGKLDLYNSGESHHILTTQEKIDIDSPTKPVDSQAQNILLHVKLDHKKDLISEVLRPVVSPKMEESVIILQYGSFEPVEVSALKKTTNTSKVDGFFNEESSDTWTLIALKRQKNQGTSKL
ncbi:hypothetical protein H5410_015976 [Solanum commersonii]|uniref:Uncharacterized protein n=1 Tax=Solanum commersonii TaxID=4109 RepID=A0A9J5ZVC4_SOLCO|nr:hypothetical protein H5410_015976 [Solanum commersonii]